MLHPDAVLVDADDADVTGAALVSIRGGAAPVGHAYTVAFAPDGIHVHHGHELSAVATVPWRDVAQIREDVALVSSKPRPALVIDVLTAEGTVPLPLVMSVSSGFQSPEGKVAKAASAVARLRDSRAEPRPDAATGRAGHSRAGDHSTTPMRRELVPGVPSTSWQRWARVPPYAGAAAAAIVVAVQLVSGSPISRGAFFPALACIVAASVVSLGFLVLANRASRRERAAGYTLQRLGDTAVDQLDPATGFVIRRAGEPQLTRDDELALRRSVASLD